MQQSENKGEKRIERSQTNILDFDMENEQQSQNKHKKGQDRNELVNRVITEIAEASEQNSNLTYVQEPIKRIKQHWFFYILTWICSFIFATENLLLFLGTLPDRDIYITFPTTVARIIFYPFATYHLCQNKTILLRLFFMVDKLLLAIILVYIGVMGFIFVFLSFTPNAWFYQSLVILYPLAMFMYVGNFRVMMVYCQWSKFQVIFFKASLLAGSTSFFILGMHYLVEGLRFTRGFSQTLDNVIQNMLLIYINAGFQFFLEMFSRMDAIDGTSGFKNDYKLHCNPEDMEALLKGRESSNQDQMINEDIQEQRQESNSKKAEPSKTKKEELQVVDIQ